MLGLMPAHARSATSLGKRSLAPVLAALRRTNATVARAWPGESEGRQPVHIVYGGAHLFRADTRAARRAGARRDRRVRAGRANARGGRWASRSIGRGCGARRDRSRARGRKLQREPVEDFRLDFEDGYGRGRTPKRTATRSRRPRGRGRDEGWTLPPFIGIRIKPMSQELHARSLRTLDMFVIDAGQDGRHGCRRISRSRFQGDGPGARRTVARACAALERKLKLEADAIAFELMIETPQSILAPTARRRCSRSSPPAADACAARTSASTTTRRSAASPRLTSICVTPRAISPGT